jgi:hypothetical protein
VFLQAVDCPNEGGFPRARRATNDHYLTPLDGEIDPSKHMKVAEPLVDVSTDDDVVSGFEPLVDHYLSLNPVIRESRIRE